MELFQSAELADRCIDGTDAIGNGINVQGLQSLDCCKVSWEAVLKYGLATPLIHPFDNKNLQVLEVRQQIQMSLIQLPEANIKMCQVSARQQ